MEKTFTFCDQQITVVAKVEKLTPGYSKNQNLYRKKWGLVDNAPLLTVLKADMNRTFNTPQNAKNYVNNLFNTYVRYWIKHTKD